MKYLSKDPQLDIPDLDHEDIIIYLPKKGSGLYKDSDYRGRDKELLSRHNIWNAHDISRNERDVICAMGFYSFTALIDMKPEPGATYIHSASEPYNEEQEISQGRINAWMDHFGMNKFQCHCSGHAGSQDLFQIVKEISPRTLYPVHTEHWDSYKNAFENVVKVSEAKMYTL